MKISLELVLPANYRVGDILAFHGRDSEQVSERCVMPVEALSQSLLGTLEKALIWEGYPACLSIQFSAQAATVVLNSDMSLEQSSRAKHAAQWQVNLQAMVRRMLGLNQDVEAFFLQYCEHPQLGGLLKQRPNLRVPLSVNPFEALCWAVTGQQISVAAAVSIRRRFIELLGCLHSSGLRCHPSVEQVAASELAALCDVGLSKTKAQTLIFLAQALACGQLELPPSDDQLLDHVSTETLRRQLLGIRGIGPWTVNYVLLRGFAYLDGSLHGDVAVRRNLQLLLARHDKISELETQQWLAQFSPWRALAAAHLWAIT
ncbi:DNA-3-methyladenine glycosylase 2 [Zhongshania guokunii]|uniref:DNA-3-methyladenine glycosylase II n=1 Tax=Zhongshania guokunii TaxID=641783 RepID=A0ABV3U304_9GAMM